MPRSSKRPRTPSTSPGMSPRAVARGARPAAFPCRGAPHERRRMYAPCATARNVRRGTSSPRGGPKARSPAAEIPDQRRTPHRKRPRVAPLRAAPDAEPISGKVVVPWRCVRGRGNVRTSRHGTQAACAQPHAGLSPPVTLSAGVGRAGAAVGGSVHPGHFNYRKCSVSGDTGPSPRRCPGVRGDATRVGMVVAGRCADELACRSHACPYRRRHAATGAGRARGGGLRSHPDTVLTVLHARHNARRASARPRTGICGSRPGALDG